MTIGTILLTILILIGTLPRWLYNGDGEVLPRQRARNRRGRPRCPPSHRIQLIRQAQQ